MARELQKIIVMGLGYIGLPTASMLATSDAGWFFGVMSTTSET